MGAENVGVDPGLDTELNTELTADAESLVGELGLVADDAGVVEVNASKDSGLIVYEAADGLAELSAKNVSFTRVALSGATRFSNVLQQILIWFEVSVHVSLSFAQQYLLLPDEHACWPPDGVFEEPPSHLGLPVQQTPSVRPGIQQ